MLRRSVKSSRFQGRRWGFSRKRRTPKYKRGAYGYGPVGGSLRGRRGQTSDLLLKQPSIIPDRYFAPLTFTVITQGATGAVGGYSANTLRPNDITDPGGSFTTGGATGVTSLLGSTPALYRSYIIHAFSVEVELCSIGNATVFGVTAAWGMLPRPSTAAAPVSVAQIANNARGKTCLISEGNTPRKLYMYHTVGEIYGQTPQTVAIADSFSAVAASPPSSLIIVDIGVQDPNAAVQISYSVKMKIKMWCEFFNRNTM